MGSNPGHFCSVEDLSLKFFGDNKIAEFSDPNLAILIFVDFHQIDAVVAVFFARLHLLSTTNLHYTQRGPSQRSGPPKLARGSLGESLNVCISARIPLQLSQLTFINVCGGT